ncbi:M28 family metallopeptidase [Clostridium gasigenes]|uniref:Zn-dependent exopeptidase M28 n=1 Tax=Clostridium gasigenes TaxID=94869 RepID=A0A7X0SAU0_9CLOT|nr:M28 family metallopeptidase [Clostridium gasigenes]MBB6714230.1 Zn-dependent exopeptidase M28 [Clostridium gasigenes]
MKKKLLYCFSLLISFVLLAVSLFFNFTYSSFDSNKVKEEVANLSSYNYAGRLPGSNENLLIGELIRKNFTDSKLVPLNETYSEDFTTLCPIKTNTIPYLTISSNGIVIEDLKYGIDFKEDMLNFKKNSITFSKSDTVNINTNSIEVITTDAEKYLFYVAKDNDFSFRSSFMSDFPYNMAIMINTNTYNKILDSVRAGLDVSVHVPFTTEEKTISNIVGVLKGSNSKLPPLVITSHYDHLGTDGLGNTYNGALDNASGTSFMLELQRSLSTYAKPKRDIIFVALNAEEFGLLGSKKFAETNKDKLEGAEVINFDMIGSENYPITFMLGEKAKDTDSKLLKSVEKLSKKYDTPYEIEYKDSSDHASFTNAGLDALSFCHSDMTKIHTPNDKVEFINTDAIDSVYTIVEAKIKDSSYGNITVFFHDKYSILIFSFLFGILVAAPFANKKKCS